MRVVASPQFSAVSVTAQHWVTMEEVTPQQLPAWLAGARSEVRPPGLVSAQQQGMLAGCRKHATSWPLT